MSTSKDILLNYLSKNWEDFKKTCDKFKNPEELLNSLSDESFVDTFVLQPSYEYHGITADDVDLDLETVVSLYKDGIFKVAHEYKEYYSKFPEKVYLENILRGWIYENHVLCDTETIDNVVKEVLEKVVLSMEIPCICCSKMVLTDSMEGLVVCKDCE